MGKIALLVSREEMIHQAHNILQEKKFEIQEMRVIHTGDTVMEARRSIADGATIIIARGLQASIIKQYTDTWGFYLSPEIGVSIFPRPDYRLGFHVALYYSYSTNSGDVLTYSMNNINNFGIRVGISF